MRPASTRGIFSFLVHDVSRMRRTFFDQALKPLGITRAQWWALANISRHAEDGMIQTELANVLETGKVSAGGLIDRLEEAGLVYRQADRSDRRVKRIFITGKGREMLDHIGVVVDDLDQILFADIPDEDLAAASAVISRVKHNLREALKAGPVAVAQPAPGGKTRPKLAAKTAAQ